MLLGFLESAWEIVSLRVRIFRVVHTIAEVGFFAAGVDVERLFGRVVGDIRIIVIYLRQLKKAPKLNALMILLECDVGSHTFGAADGQTWTLWWMNKDDGMVDRHSIDRCTKR